MSDLFELFDMQPLLHEDSICNALPRKSAQRCGKCKQHCDEDPCPMCLMRWHTACSMSLAALFSAERLSSVLTHDVARAWRSLPDWMLRIMQPPAAASSSSSHVAASHRIVQSDALHDTSHCIFACLSGAVEYVVYVRKFGIS